MNVLNEIQKRIDLIPEDLDKTGIFSVKTHIEHAEFLLNKGAELDEENLFTDVIYRTNHAFEGILKEAYKILAKKNPERKSSYTIEDYLITNEVFDKRVSDLFTNYRTNWRNPSTHDYNLFFSKDEALLAILSVTAFIIILLNQIVEQISFDREKILIEENEEIKESISKIKSKDFIDKIIGFLISFEPPQLSIEERHRSELSIIGALGAYLSADDTLNIFREPVLQRGEIFSGKPDFIIEESGTNKQVIIEVKKAVYQKSYGLNQVESYLRANTKSDIGILYFVPKRESEYKIDEKELFIGKKRKRIIILS